MSQPGYNLTTLTPPCRVLACHEPTGTRREATLTSLTSWADRSYPYAITGQNINATLTKHGREYPDSRQGWYVVGPVAQQPAPHPLIFGNSKVGSEPVIRPPTFPLQAGDTVELEAGCPAEVLFIDVDGDAIIRCTTSEGDYVGIVRATDGLLYDLETDDDTEDRVQLVSRKAQA